MTDRPIIFSAPMVKALLAGTKTQTRRVLNGEPERIYSIPSEEQDSHELDNRLFGRHEGAWIITAKPVRFVVGDRLWVREAWSHNGVGVWTINTARISGRAGVLYRADDRDLTRARYWPSIHMPREFSRLTLTVTAVKVERLQDISPDDAWEEGVNRHSSKVRQFWLFGADATAREAIYKLAAVWEFEDVWNGLHGPDAWAANPWVAAVSFTVERRNIDARKLELAPAGDGGADG